MTEAEWLSEPNFVLHVQHVEPRASARKLRLLAAAFCRAAGNLLDHPELLASVDSIERYADGATNAAELEKARSHARIVAVQAYENYVRWSEGTEREGANPMVQHQVAWAVAFAGTTPLPVTAVGTRMGEAVASRAGANTDMLAEPVVSPEFIPTLRAVVWDLFGNPFNPVVFERAWQTEAVTKLANDIYENRDFASMPALAAAFQKVGCDNPALLSHCCDMRAPHFRGCWVLDGVLGKE
jgi:hypothetical protein